MDIKYLKFIFCLFWHYIKLWFYAIMYLFTKKNKYLTQYSICKFTIGIFHTAKIYSKRRLFL